MDIVEEMRGFEVDHEPDGWLAVKMKQVSALCDEIDALRAELQRLREQEPIGFLLEHSDGAEFYNMEISANFNFTDKIQASVSPVYAAPLPAMPMQDHEIAETINSIRDIAAQYRDTQQLREQIASILRTLLRSSKAMPIPNQEPVGASKLVELMTKAIIFEDNGSTDQWEENINLGQAALNAIPHDWQLVPKCVTKEMRIGAWASAAEIRPNIKTMLDLMWSDLLKHSPAYTGSPSPRITEQDAREILESYWNSHDDSGDWLKSEDGRTLLNKLNANAVPSQAAAIPEGWQLVPVRPTGEMIDAMREKVIGAEDYVISYFNAYHAALSASPKPE